jgi:hypoxanthine-guanine phosphoribosyltransferase
VAIHTKKIKITLIGDNKIEDESTIDVSDIVHSGNRLSSIIDDNMDDRTKQLIIELVSSILKDVIV